MGDLPYRSLTWITPNSLVAVGYDYFPVLFNYNGSVVTRAGKLDNPEKKTAAAASYARLSLNAFVDMACCWCNVVMFVE